MAQVVPGSTTPVAAGGNFCCVTLKLFFFLKCDDSFFSSPVLFLHRVVFRSTGKRSVLDVDGLCVSRMEVGGRSVQH